MRWPFLITYLSVVFWSKVQSFTLKLLFAALLWHLLRVGFACPTCPPPCLPPMPPPLQADVGTSEVDRCGRRCRPRFSVFLAGNFFRALNNWNALRLAQAPIFVNVKKEDGDITGWEFVIWTATNSFYVVLIQVNLLSLRHTETHALKWTYCLWTLELIQLTVFEKIWKSSVEFITSQQRLTRKNGQHEYNWSNTQIHRKSKHKYNLISVTHIWKLLPVHSQEDFGHTQCHTHGLGHHAQLLS